MSPRWACPETGQAAGARQARPQTVPERATQQARPTVRSTSPSMPVGVAAAAAQWWVTLMLAVHAWHRREVVPNRARRSSRANPRHPQGLQSADSTVLATDWTAMGAQPAATPENDPPAALPRRSRRYWYATRDRDRRGTR